MIKKLALQKVLEGYDARRIDWPEDSRIFYCDILDGISKDGVGWPEATCNLMEDGWVVRNPIKVRPILPLLVMEEQIPNEVFQAINELIIDRWDGEKAKFSYADVKSRLPNFFFKDKYFKIEYNYKLAGWHVLNLENHQNYIFRKKPFLQD